MADIPPWSHSTLNAFETCPKKYYHLKVVRDVVEPQGEAAKWGSEVHTALENRALGVAGLAPPLDKYEPIIDKILANDGKRLVEHKMAITKGFGVAEWGKSWCRGIVDLGVVDDKKAALFDWKTGKRKPGSDQLKLMALLAFVHYPWIEKVVTGFIWLKESKIDKEKFTREQVPELWQDFLPRVTRMERAYQEDKWPARPSGLCKNWCHVKQCEFCGK